MTTNSPTGLVQRHGKVGVDSGKFKAPHSAYLLMLGSALAFAGMSACTYAMKDRADWRLTAVSRSGLAFLLTFSIATWRGVPLILNGPKTLWMRSITGSCGMLCTFFAYAHLTLSGSVTLLNSFPLWVAILSWPVLGVAPTKGVWAALVSGLLGVALIAQSYVDERDLSDHRWLAMGLALMGSFSTAVVMFGLHRLRFLNPLTIVVHFGGVSTCVCIGYTLVTALTGRPIRWMSADATTWVLLSSIGMLATAGQILMTTAFQHGPPDRLATLGLTQVVFAVGFDLALWGHALDGWLATGIVLVLGPAVWLVARRIRSAPANLAV